MKLNDDFMIDFLKMIETDGIVAKPLRVLDTHVRDRTANDDRKDSIDSDSLINQRKRSKNRFNDSLGWLSLNYITKNGLRSWTW